MIKFEHGEMSFVDPSICYLTSIFGGAKPKAAAQPAPLPTRDDPSVKARAEEERLAARKRRGRASTVLTTPGDTLGTAQVTRPGAQALG